MRMRKVSTATPTIRLRDGAVERLKDEFQLGSDSALAAHVGITQGHYSRVTRKQGQPGSDFVARFLVAVRPIDLDFYDLFEVVMPSKPEA